MFMWILRIWKCSFIVIIHTMDIFPNNISTFTTGYLPGIASAKRNQIQTLFLYPTKWFTHLKTNISPHKRWFEDYFYFRTDPFLGDMLIFRGYIKVTCSWYRQIQVPWVAQFDESTRFWATRWICYLEKEFCYLVVWSWGGVFVGSMRNKVFTCVSCVFSWHVWIFS